MLGDLHGGVDVRAEVVAVGELENVGVEGGHLRLDVVEKVSLLHMVTVNSDGDLLEELGHGESGSLDGLLYQSLIGGHQGRAGFLREAVSRKRLHAEVGLANIVNNEYRVLELLAALH